MKNVNLKVSKGQSVAIIGASGSGKSTLADVLLGLLEPQKGGIYLDGKKITEDLDHWARTIGYVPQTINLASTSIRKNVAFGEREEDIDNERKRLLILCLKELKLWREIEGFGYPVGRDRELQ